MARCKLDLFSYNLLLLRMCENYQSTDNIPLVLCGFTVTQSLVSFHFGFIDYSVKLAFYNSTRVKLSAVAEVLILKELVQGYTCFSRQALSVTAFWFEQCDLRVTGAVVLPIRSLLFKLSELGLCMALQLLLSRTVACHQAHNFIVSSLDIIKKCQSV